MTERTTNGVELYVRDNRIVVGDAFLPPRGTVVDNVPNGRCIVNGRLNDFRGSALLSEFKITFTKGAAAVDTKTFSIDGGVIGIATSYIEFERKSLLTRWRMRREFEKKLNVLFGAQAHIMNLCDEHGIPWVVVAPALDNVYRLVINRTPNGVVSSVKCQLLQGLR